VGGIGDADANGIFAQSTGLNGGSDISVRIESGTVQGGSGFGSGVRILDGATTTNLLADLDAPGGNLWGTNQFEFVATSALSTLQLQNVAGACTIDDVRVMLVGPRWSGLLSQFRRQPHH
jgi:hypothetical protein